MIAKILSFLSGGIIGQIAKPLKEAYQAKLNAQNDSERMAADLLIAKLEKEIEMQSENRRMTAGFWEMRLVTFLIAAPFVAHLWAVSLDTIFKFGWGIPAFPQPFDAWEGNILLSFFGLYAAGRGIQTLATVIAKRK